MSLPSIFVLAVVLAMFGTFMVAVGYVSTVAGAKAEPPKQA